MSSRNFAMMIRALFVVAGCAALVMIAGAAAQQAPATLVEPPALVDERPRDYPGLHNVVAYHDGFYSGSVPEGDAGFDTIAGMGVRTIISVDGAEPDVVRAAARGMRTIHLPIGYNGFDERRKLQLVRATRDALREGPVYIHCHHGRHRSAGAAGAIVASLGWATPEDMTARMKISGTSPSYRGLYACTAGAVMLTSAAIDAVPADFPEISRPTGFLKSMVELDEIESHLRAIEKAGWATPGDHPDLVPAAEAGRMADILGLLAGDERSRGQPAEFGDVLRANGELAQTLEDMLAAGERDAARLSGQFKLVLASCKDCHVKHRD
jgi:hypothetical protein